MDTETAPTAPARTAATPVGTAPVIAEARVAASLREGDEIVLQRLASDAGPLLRLGYRRADRMIRGPVSLATDDVARLLRAVRADPGFEEVLLFHRQ